MSEPCAWLLAGVVLAGAIWMFRRGGTSKPPMMHHSPNIVTCPYCSMDLTNYRHEDIASHLAIHGS